jgi:hypothetical protein
MLESANAYTAINEQLVDELPKFLGLTTQYFDIIVMEFSKVQMFYYAQVKAKVQSFYVEHLDATAASTSTDKEQALIDYLANMNITEDYIMAMKRPDGPIERMSKISLIRNVSSEHGTDSRLCLFFCLTCEWIYTDQHSLTMTLFTTL